MTTDTKAPGVEGQPNEKTSLIFKIHKTLNVLESCS